MKLANGKVTLHAGDCLEVLATLAENSIDAVVTDPPYHFTSIVKRFGKEGSAPAQYGTDGVFARASRGFMGKEWDGGDIAFRPETWALVWRVLKPGGHLVAFGAPKNYHRLACAIEDAGFEIRDSLMWVFGSGFPKSMNVGKALDKLLGENGTYGEKRHAAPSSVKSGWGRPWMEDADALDNYGREYIPASDAAKQYAGYGTSLKPAYEPVVLARKPLSEGTVAANVLKWGCGALNIDATRVGTESTKRTTYKIMSSKGARGGAFSNQNHEYELRQEAAEFGSSSGRWPANLCHDGSQEVVDLFPHTKSGTIDPSKHIHKNGKGNALSGSKDGSLNNYLPHQFHQGDEGSAARFFFEARFSDAEYREQIAAELLDISSEWDENDRERAAYARWFGSKLMRRAQSNSEPHSPRLFYCAKANKHDRAGSKHPTVKPVSLMRWLVRMVTPPGGTVLDPFAGSGTTGLAAVLEGFDAQLIEREAEYQADIQRRFDD